jgi:hypothetical protein
MEIYAQFYPALRRLLRLGLAFGCWAAMTAGGGAPEVPAAFYQADEFLKVFDAERDSQ